jgi:mannose-1-phosphate guanylyltransferase
MVQSGKFLWNAGMFVMAGATLIAELEQHAPALAAAMRSFTTLSELQLKRRYHALSFDSFDRVVAEKSRHVLGVRARFQWHDVGSWEGLWEALRGNGSNVLSGNVLALGADGVLARARERLMVLLGVKDIVAVDTGDVILIARRSESQDVRKVIDELQRRGLKQYL